MISIDCIKEMVKQADASYKGIQKGFKSGDDLVLFNDPVTETTLALPIEGITPNSIRAKLWKRRREFEAHRKPLISSKDIVKEIGCIKNLIKEILLAKDFAMYASEDILNKQTHAYSRLEVLQSYLEKR